MIRAAFLSALLLGGVATISTGCDGSSDDKGDEDEGGDDGVTDDSGGSGSGTGDDTATGDCDTLGPPECAAAPECNIIGGRPLIPIGEGFCYAADGDAMPFGCMSADEGCGDAETIAAGPEDPTRCFWFPSTCIPDGWSVCTDVGTVNPCPTEGGDDEGGTDGTGGGGGGGT